MILEMSLLGFVGFQGLVGFFRGGHFYLKKWSSYVSLFVILIFLYSPTFQFLELIGLPALIEKTLIQFFMTDPSFQVLVTSLNEYQYLITKTILPGFYQDLMVFAYVFILNQPIGLSISEIFNGMISQAFTFFIGIGLLTFISYLITHLLFHWFHLDKDREQDIINRFIGICCGFIRAAIIITIIMSFVIWISETLSLNFMTPETILYQSNEIVPTLRFFAEFALLIIENIYPGGN
jgi:hypothetical protein